MAATVSLVLPTYNQAHYLPAALDGVFAQTYPHYELIVVNDGCTDETPSILADYHQRYEFTIIEQENQGLPTALNAGFSGAQGEYLTWTSSDNVMLPEMLATLVSVLDTHPDVGLVYADWEVIDETGQVIAIAHSIEYDRHLLLMDNYINACFLYRRKCQEKVGCYDPRMRGGEDWDYWLRISRFYKMVHVSKPLYQYRVHSASLTARSKHLVAGTSLISHREFFAHWRRKEPLAWYYAKLKWNVLKRWLGHRPTVRYKSVLNQLKAECGGAM